MILAYIPDFRVITAIPLGIPSKAEVQVVRCPQALVCGGPGFGEGHVDEDPALCTAGEVVPKRLRSP